MSGWGARTGGLEQQVAALQREVTELRKTVEALSRRTGAGAGTSTALVPRDQALAIAKMASDNAYTRVLEEVGPRISNAIDWINYKIQDDTQRVTAYREKVAADRPVVFKDPNRALAKSKKTQQPRFRIKFDD